MSSLPCTVTVVSQAQTTFEISNLTAGRSMMVGLQSDSNYSGIDVFADAALITTLCTSAFDGQTYSCAVSPSGSAIWVTVKNLSIYTPMGTFTVSLTATPPDAGTGTRPDTATDSRVACSGSVADAGVSHGVFTATCDMTTPRSAFAATLLASGKVLVTDDTGSAELYDPTVGAFISTGHMTTSRSGYTATLLPGGKVLVAGGDWAGQTAELYDPTVGTFALTGKMLAWRSYHSATLLLNGQVLIAGGGQALDGASAELYDAAAEIFTATGNMTESRSSHTATLLADGRVLVVGRHYGWVPPGADVYDPAKGTFTAAGTMHAPRSAFTTTLLPDGRVLIAGGYNMTGWTVEYYNPTKMAFESYVGNGMAAARFRHTATLLSNGKVLIAGGQDGDGGPSLRSAEIYDPATGTFAATGSMLAERAAPTATLVSGGRVLIAGGYDSGYNTWASAELYNP
jgi:hypothetical protein